jgi:hypothetical protein
VGSEAKNTGVCPGRPHNLAWKLWQRCSTARLVPRATRYTYHTMNGTRSDCSHYMQQRPLPSSAPAWVKASPRYLTHRLWGGDDELLPVYRSSAVLGASEDISPLLPPRSYSGRAWYTRAPHVAVNTFGGREISTIDLYGRRFVNQKVSVKPIKYDSLLTLWVAASSLAH